MKLCELLCDVDYAVARGSNQVEISKLCNHTDDVGAGSVFVCIPGFNTDGHDLIALAISKGAVVVVVEKAIDIKCISNQSFTIIQVGSTRRALAYMARTFYGYPEKKLITIGITGTKGKTTVAYMVRQILERAGYQVGMIGTIEVIMGDKVVPAGNTTPESVDIQRYFREMVERGCTHVVMEVSSQALLLHRAEGIIFDVGAFTNIGDDHIGGDEHPDFDNYLACKSRLFQQCKVGIGNKDDRYYEQVFANATCEMIGIGIHNRVEEVKLFRTKKEIGVTYRLDTDVMRVSMPGIYSVYNSLIGLAICRQLGVFLGIIKDTLTEVKVPGRNEVVSVQDGVIWMIDYAHNAMSLESLLVMVRQYQPKRLICIFGCGGNRSKVRRYEMGEVAGRLADLTILTTDNPRDEEPQQIIDDIRVGIEKADGDYIEIVDRKEAVNYGLSCSREGDFIVLAGKGHEAYQEIKGVKYPMDDRALILEGSGNFHK